MKILVAEDDSTSALVITRALEKLGHEPTLAPNGEAAWDVWAKNRNEFRLIISDWMMPGLDGLVSVHRGRGIRVGRFTSEVRQARSVPAPIP